MDPRTSHRWWWRLEFRPRACGGRVFEVEGALIAVLDAWQRAASKGQGRTLSRGDRPGRVRADRRFLEPVGLRRPLRGLRFSRAPGLGTTAVPRGHSTTDGGRAATYELGAQDDHGDARA